MALYIFAINELSYVYDPCDNGIYAISCEERANLEAHAIGASHGECMECSEHSDASSVDIGSAGIGETLGVGRYHELLPLTHFAADEECAKRLRGGMTQLTLSVTEKCDLRCRYCVYGVHSSGMRTHSGTVMSDQTARIAVNYFLEHAATDHQPVISFYGGEPFLNEHLIVAVVEHASSVSSDIIPQFSIATNGYRMGTIVSRNTLEYLVSHEVRFQFSLDGYPEIHDRHRRTECGRPTYVAVENAVHRLLEIDNEYHRNISFAVTVAPMSNIRRVCSYFRDFAMYKKMGIAAEPALTVTMADLFDGELKQGAAFSAWKIAHEHEIEQLRAEYTNACISDERDRLGPAVLALFDADMLRLYSRQRTDIRSGYVFGGCCVPGVRKLYVTSKGEYQACERMAHGVNIGNVTRGVDIDEVKKMQRTFESQFDDECKKCWAIRLCGLCYTSIQGVSNGTATRKKQCDIIRKHWSAALRTYVQIIENTSKTPTFMRGSLGVTSMSDNGV